MFTKNFKELDKNDAPIAGGKGASLGEMTRAEIPVPPGFVVLSDAFEKFLSETDLTVEIEALLGTVDNQKMHTVENASEKIQELILDAKMPEDIIKEIEIEFKKLDTKYVAVRSSATAEDGAEHAWAGQLNSYLNTTKENLLENIQKCWASLFTPRAIFYRFEKYSAQSPSPIGRGVRGEGGKKEVQYGDEKISVAVVIQKMIQSEKSGIAFSVHPVTEDYNQLIIEAGFGLGEAIVSGSITPDSYVVDKSRIKNEELRIKNEELRNKEAIIDVNVNIQNKGLYRSCHLARRGEGGISGNEWRDIPEPQSSSQVLSEKEILELSDLIIKIENHYGFPCDIEWAEENGKFYITQSRPITTLKSFDKDNIKKENEGTEIILSNAQSREHSLFYAYVWTESDQNNIKKYSGKTVKNLLFKREFNDPRLHVFYDSGEMQNIMQDIADNFRKNENLFEKIERDIQIQSEKMLLYINNVKKIKNIDELMEFKSEWLEWWSAMAMIFIIPNIDGISNDIHKKALAIRGKIEKYSDDIDRIFVNFFKTKYPRSVDLVNVITPEELFNFENLSNKEIDKIKLRKNGFALFNGNILTLNELGEDLKLKNIILEKMEITSGIEEISGICAYSGTVHGKIRKIILKNDISKIKKGEILLTHMTSPDFLSAFKKAIAVITDEGGATCHAAITSRELKKPCIVGTKIATQVLKDGDLVEVDADEAVVRILKRADENVKEVDVLKSTKDTVFSKQITYTFIPVICFESAIRSYHNNPLQKKLKIKNFPKIVEILTDKFEGWDDQNIQKITKAEDIKFVIQESRSIIIQYKASLQKFLQLDYIQLSNHDLLQNVKLLDEICMEVYQRYIFFIHEFFETDDSEMIELLPKVRIELSEFVSDIYKCCDYIIEALAKRFDSVSWQTFTYATFDEIIDLLDDPQKIDEFKKISGRSIAFIYNGKDLATIKKKELVVEIINYLTNQEIVASGNCKIIKGNAVSGGTAKGLVIKILEYDYEKINDALSGKSDYILVTPMTRPEIVSYLKDAKAIITDEGGITCHAAIVSRELKIPCIVGTKIATQVLKDGDLVEVDADRGVVKILKKIEINNSEKEKYVKIFNRSLFLIGCQNYDLGERVETKKITPVKYFMNPVFNNLPKKGTDVFYNFTDPAQNPKWIVDYFNNNRDQLLKIKETYYRDSDLLRKLINDPTYKDYQKLFDLTIKIWPMVAISNMLGDNRDNIQGVDEDLLGLYREMRKYSDGLIHNSHLKIAKIIKEIVPQKYKKYYKHLQYEEVVNGNYPEIEELENRMKGYIFHNGKLFTNLSLEEYAQRNNYVFVGFEANNNISENSISGQIAHEGKVKGYVKVIFEVEEVDKVKKGDVLVTSMTTPDFIVAMKKASAFVTDEGGITCHAAIVAREMGKPCIIGTKIATQVLKDGDLVEVDANEGVVRILKKANEKKEINFEKVFVRDLTFLLASSGFYNYPGFEKKFDNVILNSPVLKQANGNIVEFWIQKKIADKRIRQIGRELMDDPKKLKDTMDKYEEVSKKIKKLLNKKESKISDVINLCKLFIEFRFPNYVMFESSIETGWSQRVCDWSKIQRKKDEKLWSQSDDFIRKALHSKGFSFNQAKKISLKELIEFEKGNFEINCLDDKEVFVEDCASNTYLGTMSNIADENNFTLVEHDTEFVDEIKGEIAYKGKIKGHVKKVFTREDITKVEKGDILVSSMTTPDFILAMKNATAIVTDEGGIICHAAIFSREMKKPCIIGTKIATQVLKDGDLVEVDAEKGIVKILKRV